MNLRFLLFLLIATLVSCKSSPESKTAGHPATQVTKTKPIVFQARDRELLEEIFVAHKEDTETRMSVLMVEVGRFFLGTPYVAFTLETEAEEQIIINLRELDCTTFAENCLAISRTIKSGKLSFEQFAGELLVIRYRDGRLNGYPSRLHYFCDWIHNNEQKKLVENSPDELPMCTFHKEINFMSTHPDSYRQLREDSALVGDIAEQEKLISSREMLFIAEEDLADVESGLMDGDIVGITTSIDGLAIQHVGILVRVDGRIHLMHASSDAKKVVLSDNPLEDYLLSSKSTTGIMLARPL
jgi:hypothetical protein